MTVPPLGALPAAALGLWAATEPLSAVGKGREDISKGDPGDKRKQNVVQQPQGRRQHHKGG